MSTGVSRVIIPSNVRKTIDDIKEIAAGKHTDEDIYAMLKECNMDPNDTAQKLLYLDTFHEVKGKRDRKKTKGSSQTFDDYRWMSGMQRRARDGREIISANYITDSKYGASTGDVSGRRYIKKENGVNNSKDRISKVSKPPARKTEDASIHPSKEFAVEVAGDDPHELVKSTTSASVSGVYSSSSDPVLVPALNPRNPGTVGTIKREIVLPSQAAAESFRSGLTFGSLDPQLDQSISCGKDSMPVETVPANDTTSMELGSYKDASSAAQRGDYPDNLLSHQNGSENISPFEVSGASHVYDPSKLEKCPLSAGSQSPLLQTPPDYSLGFVPPMLGPHLVCLEGPEQQGGNSQAPSTLGSNQPVAQPIGLGQSSVSVPPHLFPLVRQPFPPNYMPYNPYIPHLYMPQSAHQFLGPSGFPQQPSPANFYMSPSVTAAGVKLPLPSLYKPAAIAGNLNHFGIPTGYSSYGSSTVSYSGTPALVCSASNENLAAPDLKEKNVYSMHKQNEDSHYRNSAPGRDQSMLQTNYFYNIPQDQHIAVAPAHSSNSSYPGINVSQTLVAQSTVQPLAQQPQTVARSGDSGLPTSGAFQQPQATIHWNNKLLNRENV